MFLPSLAVCLAASMFAAPETFATDDPFEHTNGVFVGHVMGKAAQRVTLEMRGTSLVVLESEGISVMALEPWQIAGPGGKAGDLQWKTTATAKGAISRSGKTKGPPKEARVGVRLRLWPENEKAVLCATRPGDKTPIERVPPSGAGDAPGGGVTCYDVTRVWAPIGGEPAPDFECMRECRQQNMARAVGPEVIEADCRRACTQR
jgi:hypothetical protein